MLKRKHAIFELAGLSAAAIYLASRASASAQTKAALHVITTPIEFSAGVYYAQAHGSFDKYGLDVGIQALSSGEAAAVAVVGGTANVGVGNLLSLAIAHEKRLPITLIAPASAYVDNSPTIALVVAKASPLQRAADLDGKTIAVPAIGDLNTISTRAWLEKNGGNAKSVKFLEVPTPQMSSMIAKGVVDAAVLASPLLYAALAQSSRVLGLPYGAIGKTFIINAWYASNDWLTTHRDEAKRFAMAVTEGQAWAMSDPAASAKVLEAVLKIDPTLLSTVTRVSFARRFEPALVQPVIDFAARYGVLKSAFSASELYEQFL